MQGAGVNPSGLGSFFEKLRGQEYVPESQQVEYVRTHPLTSNRISALETLIATTDLRDKPYPDTWIEQHARMKAKLIGFINPGRVAWEYDDRDQSVAAQYARSIAAYRQNEIPEAISLIDGLIKIEPDNPYFHELKGQMLVDFSRIEEALPSYKRAVALMPEAGLFRIALGHALIESTGSSNARLKEAIPQLKEALKTEKRSGRVHRLLATAYGRLGEEGMAKLHLAEEAFLERNLSYAGQQAKAAQESFKASSPEWIAARDIITQIENLEPISN
jgi:predicted Zn-dependent protease